MPLGRPTLYKEQYPEQAYKLTLLGLTLEELAEFFSVCLDTLHEWKKVYPDFSDAIARGRTIADAEVAVKLRERAIGYSHEAVKIFLPAGAREPVYAHYIEHYPPDPQAASIWLFNRRPDKWRRDRREAEDPHEIGLTIKVTGGLPDVEAKPPKG